MNKLLLSLTLLVLCHSISFSQTVMSNQAPYNSATHLISNVFAGGNVTINNVQSYGADRQIGFFSNGGGFGIDSGIVLSTGNIADISFSANTNVTGTMAPGTGTGVNFGPTWFGTAASNNLTSVSNLVPTILGQGTAASDMNDAAAIWFDFIPTKDTMRFKFVFASSEWNSWPCSSFNDAFAFFVSGPGITGTFNAPAGYPNGAQNFANVPGTSPALPITITSITHPTATGSCTSANNTGYYVTNVQANSGLSASLTAYTTVMEVEFPVQPCQTYNFCMAIADGSDGALNSYVMLEANSFDASGVTITAAPTYTSLGDSILYEGCGGATIDFVRHDSLHLADSIAISVSGNAINGVDYSTIPDTLYFAANQDSFSLTINMIDDNIIEGNETLYIWVSDTAISTGCGNQGDSLMLVIHDPIPITTLSSIDTITCTDNSVDLAIEVPTGFPSYNFNWSNGSTDSINTISPVPWSDTTYYVTITDACGSDTAVDSATIIIQNPPVSISTPDDTITCEDNNVLIYTQVLQTMPNVSFQWSNGSNAAAFLTANPYQDSTYIVTVTQACANVHIVDTFNLVLDNPPFTLSSLDDSLTCLDGPLTIGTNVSYTTPNFDYVWSTGSTDSSIVVQPNSSTTYVVTVTDACGINSVIDSIDIKYVINPYHVQVNDQVIPCIGDSTVLTANITGGYMPYTYNWSTGGNNPSVIVSPDSNTTYYVTVTDQCADTIAVDSAQARFFVYPPLQITPWPTDSILCPETPIMIHAGQVTGGSGNYVTSWDNFNTTITGILVAPDSTEQFLLQAVDLCNHDTTSYLHTVSPEIHDPFEVHLVEDTTVCIDEVVPLVASAIGGGGNYTYKWSTGETSNAISTYQYSETQYTLTVTEACEEKIIKNSIVRVSTPEAYFDKENIEAGTVAFINFSTGANTYIWDFGDGTQSEEENPWHEFLEPEVHLVTLYAYDTINCVDSFHVEIAPPLQVYIPTGFSPNGDNINDVFEIKGTGFQSSTIKFGIWIYNRWGQLVFESHSADFQWDGTFQGEPALIDTYTYTITVEGFETQKYTRTGTITIVK